MLKFLFIMFVVIPASIVVAAIIYWLWWDSTSVSNITSVELLGTTRVYSENFENTGFSFTSKGNARWYYGKRKRYQGLEYRFYVTYLDKEPRTVTAMEDSSRYSILMNCIKHPWSIENTHRNPKTYPETYRPKLKQETRQITTENLLPTEEKTEILLNDVKDVGETQEELMVTEENKMTEIIPKSYISDIDFEILPNNLGLNVKYLSCEITEKEENISTRVQFVVEFGEGKNLSGKRIICSIVNDKNKIIDTTRHWEKLTGLSGTIIALNFNNKIGEIPTKILIGIANY